MQKNGGKSRPQQPSVPPDLRPEVKAAVDDLLNNTATDSVSEWLQREFARLMHREAQYRKNNPTLRADDQ